MKFVCLCLSTCLAFLFSATILTGATAVNQASVLESKYGSESFMEVYRILQGTSQRIGFSILVVALLNSVVIVLELVNSKKHTGSS